MTQGRLVTSNNLSTQTLVFDFRDNTQGFRTFNVSSTIRVLCHAKN